MAGSVFLAGYVIVILSVLNRALGYFDELSGAVAALVLDRERPVTLPADLAIAQGELNAIRGSSLAAARAAKAAERRKDELVTYLAHDIRTPLTSVLGYLSLIDEAPDLPDEARRRYVATALAKAEDLEALVGELFEITRYNLQAIPIERAPVDARLFLEQMADEFLPALRERSLTAEVAAPEGEALLVDPDRMARAVGNVLRNAIAYADAGGTVHLSARRVAETGGWEIGVSDMGREIAPEHLRVIFDQFYREDRSRRAGTGAGLGLAIAREIVRAHGGDISAASEGGVTTFTITLP